MDFLAIPLAPGGEGIMGHNHDFRTKRMVALRRVAESSERLLRLRIPMPGVHAAVANDPDLVQEMLVEKAKSFDKSDMLRFSLWNLAGEGLFTSNGDLWKKQRRLMAPLFTPRALAMYADDMVECAHRTVVGWRDRQELLLAHETTRLTMGIAGKTLFEADTFSEADEIGEALTIALGWTGWIMARPFALSHIVARRLMMRLAEKTTALPSAREHIENAAAAFRGPIALMGTRGRALARSIEFLDDHVQKMIDERRRYIAAGKSKDDLLTRLLGARDEDDGTAMSDRQVRDEVLTLFVAGHETTATGLAWTLYYACKNPEVYAAMEREADAVGDHPRAADLERLDLCLRAFKEALRLAPPVYVFGRDTNAPVSIAGYDLPAPTNVMVSPWAMHHTERYWKDPERFDPDRFLPKNEGTRHRYSYLPFGAGPRVCLGNHFAYMEAQFSLAVLMRQFRFELLGDDEPDAGATLRPKNGIRVRVLARQPKKN